MKLTLVALIVVAACGTSVAQQRTQVHCNDSGTQAELNACASERAEKADAELKVAYTRLIKAASGDPAALSKFRALENSWLRFRAAFLDASYPATDKQSAYGSMFPMEFDDLAAVVTREQVNRLEQLLKDYEGNK
jgi:uncharacterized protein YecT (DUF1311 family)